MKTGSIASVMLAFVMMTGSYPPSAENSVKSASPSDVQVAQHSDYRDDQRAALRTREGSYRDSRDDRHADWRKHRYERRNDRIYYPPYGRAAYKKKHKRGAGPWHDLYKGNRLPRYYRSRHYRIHHWHAHGLYAPPRGHYWAQVGSDYVLVAIATAVILDMVLHH